MVVEGHDTAKKSSFGHAVVLTECLWIGTTIEIKLKNSLEGAHLKGVVSYSQISSNQQIQLTQIKNQNPDLHWTMKCYLTLFVNF